MTEPQTERRFRPGETCPECGRTMHGFPCIHHEDNCPILLSEWAIEREAQGIPPSDTLRPIIESFRYSEPLLTGTPEHRMWERNEQTLNALVDALAATPSGGIPLIDVELLARAIRRYIRGTPGSTIQGIAVEYQRLSESSPAEEGAEWNKG